MTAARSSVESVRESHLPVPGARLFVREVGAGAPLVILHGGPDFNHHYLLPEMDSLAGARRLVYYDQRGRGKSARGVDPQDVTIESEVDDLDRLREHLGLEAIAVLGHSWGGLLAMEYATRHPDRVSHLVLLNTAPASHADLTRFREQRQATEAEALAKMRALSATRAFAEGDVATEAEYYRLHYGATLRRPEHREAIVGRLRSHFTPEDILKARAIEERLYEQTWLRPDYDLVPRLRRSKARTVVIHGGYDFVPLECSKRIADAVPGARLVVLEDCGHFSYLERPAAVFDAVVAGLSRR
jgi:proline iminopeptidase